MCLLLFSLIKVFLFSSGKIFSKVPSKIGPLFEGKRKKKREKLSLH